MRAPGWLRRFNASYARALARAEGHWAAYLGLKLLPAIVGGAIGVLGWWLTFRWWDAWFFAVYMAATVTVTAVMASLELRRKRNAHGGS
jgi:Kef-type K+ transport system membrane component KefB